MSEAISLPGLRAETLLGFLSALGTLQVIVEVHADAALAWREAGGGWVANLHVPNGEYSGATAVAATVFHQLERAKGSHPILQWERFLTKAFTDERGFFNASALATLENSGGEAFTSMFTSQLPAIQGDALEHFDHPFRAARKDYYLGNLQSVLKNTKLDHVVRTIAFPWDYGDAMANQSLRLDHGDDRRHAYQWHAPTEDPARQKSGCMLGANRLAIEAFPLFPCIPAKTGNTAVGFTCKSKTSTWITWPVWTVPCSLRVVASLLNLAALTEPEPPLSKLRQMGIAAILQSRRLPLEKNKVFLPPVCTAC